jgi:beclin 1
MRRRRGKSFTLIEIHHSSLNLFSKIYTKKAPTSMGTIAGSAIDLDVLYLAPVGENNNNNNTNASSSSRPSSRLANAQPSSSSPTTKTNAFNAAGENTKEGNVTVVVDAGTTDYHQTTSDGDDLNKKSPPPFFRCQKCKVPLEFYEEKEEEKEEDRDRAKRIADMSGKLKVTVGEKQFRDFLLEEKEEEEIVNEEEQDESNETDDAKAASSYVHLPTSVQRTKTSDALKAAGKTAATLSRIFDIASEKTKQDFPLCETCAKEAEVNMEKMCEDLEEECEKYERAIASLDLSKGGGGQNGKEREEEGAKKKKQERLEELELELERAFERDKAIELEVEKLELELEKQKVRKRALQRNAARVKKAEFEIWHEANQFEIDAKSLKEERDALETKLERASTQLDLLRRTNVYNDAFHIWHDGPFGTINGFRLGRTSMVPVEWDEINAAWGMATLLLQSLANAMKIEFRSHALRPMGSFPAVCEINANTNTVSQCYDLFGPVNIMTSHKYDRAICGFLACLDELGRYFAERDFEMGVEPVFRYPYSIEADKVDGKKVTFTFNRDEKWTAALKLVLTDLKMAVSYVASRNG